MLRSIKGTLTTLTVASFIAMVVAIIAISVFEHEKLYKTSVKSDLDSLSENMSNDLIPLLSMDMNQVELTTALLKLDSYQNIVIAAIYDKNWELKQFYLGQSERLNTDNPLSHVPKNVKSTMLGVRSRGNDLIALKRIGESVFPQGYLLIIKDAGLVLEESKYSLLMNLVPIVVVVLMIVLYPLIKMQNDLLVPINKLSDLANLVTQTKDYSVRFSTKGKLEVEHLAVDFNNMMATIEAETFKNEQSNLQLLEQQKAMERLANFDSLTGLANRQFFMETLRVELAKVEREKSNLALMYLDLDGFKEVNDNYGHEVGDALLIEVANSLPNYLRNTDVIARLGGDEFLILLHKDPNDFELNEIASRIVGGLSRSFSIKGWELNISASIGIAKATDSQFNLSEFITNADIAMYRSKMSGKGTHTAFLPEMMEDNRRKLSIANALLPAIKNDEFTINYQPKVNASSQIVGYEALIRWTSLELGFVSPAEFIPIAESSGKIKWLTEWVVERVCRDTQEILNHHKSPIVISINLSAHDIKRISLLEFIKLRFEEFKVAPSVIEFEVTESAYLENFEVADVFLSSIKAMGSGIALDDFGTGYSSLGYLTKMPINTLKIDKQFVDELGISERSTMITKTIIELAKQLNLIICAEGVETKNQMDFLIENECHQLQGYLFGKPQPLREVLSLPEEIKM